jgi:hypothetical protein
MNPDKIAGAIIWLAAAYMLNGAANLFAQSYIGLPNAPQAKLASGILVFVAILFVFRGRKFMFGSFFGPIRHNKTDESDKK